MGVGNYTVIMDDRPVRVGATIKPPGFFTTDAFTTSIANLLHRAGAISDEKWAGVLENTFFKVNDRDRQLIKQFRQLTKLFESAGFPSRVIPLAIAQAYTEEGDINTGGFKRLAMDINNLTGIIYVKQPGASDSGIKMGDSKYHLAKFNSMQAWARDYKRILSKGNPAPITATNVGEFVDRLKRNNYFGKGDPWVYHQLIVNILRYEDQLLSLLKNIAVRPDTNIDPEKFIKDVVKDAKPIYNKNDQPMAWWQWVIVAAGAVTVIKSIR